MEIRRELLDNKGEVDYYTLWRGWKPDPHRLSLRGTEEAGVYELYKRLFLEERDMVVIRGSLEECVKKGNELAKEIYPDREDDTIADSIEARLRRNIQAIRKRRER